MLTRLLDGQRAAAIAADLRPSTLILAGDDHPIIPLVNARIMHGLIPGSRLHIYRGGHLELAAAAYETPAAAASSAISGYSGWKVASWNRLPSGSANTVRRIGGR